MDVERVTSAIKRLERHPRLDYPEGVPTNDPNGWENDILFYHLLKENDPVVCTVLVEIAAAKTISAP